LDRLEDFAQELSESAEKNAVIEGLHGGETKILQMIAESDSTGTILTASFPI
jgi:hypothetical protein